MKMMQMLLIGAAGAAGYFVGRSKGIADQKAAAAAGTNLLGQPNATASTVSGTTPVTGSSWAQNVGLTPSPTTNPPQTSGYSAAGYAAGRFARGAFGNILNAG